MKSKIKRFSQNQLAEEPIGRCFIDCINWGTVRLLGIFWKEYWTVYKDAETGDYIFKYK